MKSEKQMKLIFTSIFKYFMCDQYKLLMRYLSFFYTKSLKSGVDFALYKVYTSQLELPICQLLQSLM